MNQEMPKTLTTAIKSLSPKAPLIQGPTSLVGLLGASASLHLSGLSLLLISLLGALGLEIKNTLLLPLGETAAASSLLKIEAFESPMALNADSFKNDQSVLGFHQEAKQPFLPFELEKRNKLSVGIAPGGSAPEAKVHS